MLTVDLLARTIDELMQAQERGRIISPGVLITLDAMAYLATLQRTVARSLFTVESKGTKTHDPWLYEVPCDDCGAVEVREGSKDEVLGAIFSPGKYGRRLCGPCRVEAAKGEAEREMGEQADAHFHRSVRTLEYVEAYLNPEAKWSSTVKRYDRFCAISEARWLDEEYIVSEIRGMSYQDFLKTPYWKAIADYVRYKQDHTCRTCSKPCIDVHHPNYDIHGYEHRAWKQLTALCRECHHAITFQGID